MLTNSIAHTCIQLCGARVLHAVGRSSQALGVLEDVYEVGGSEIASHTAFVIAQLHAGQQNDGDSRRWLDKIDLGDVRDPDLLAKIEVLREELESHGK